MLMGGRSHLIPRNEFIEVRPACNQTDRSRNEVSKQELPINLEGELIPATASKPNDPDLIVFKFHMGPFHAEFEVAIPFEGERRVKVKAKCYLEVRDWHGRVMGPGDTRPRMPRRHASNG